LRGDDSAEASLVEWQVGMSLYQPLIHFDVIQYTSIIILIVLECGQ